jgi:hypothetical protein
MEPATAMAPVWTADRGIAARIEGSVGAGGFEVDGPAHGALRASEVDLAAFAQLLPAKTQGSVDPR